MPKKRILKDWGYGLGASIQEQDRLTDNDVNPEFPGEWRTHLIQYALLASILLCLLCSITPIPFTFQLLDSACSKESGRHNVGGR